MDNWDNKNKITTLKTDTAPTGPGNKLSQIGFRHSILLQTATSGCVPGESLRMVFLHREIITVGHNFQVPQMCCRNSCLDTCPAWGVEKDLWGGITQGSLWMSPWFHKAPNGHQIDFPMVCHRTHPWRDTQHLKWHKIYSHLQSYIFSIFLKLLFKYHIIIEYHVGRNL